MDKPTDRSLTFATFGKGRTTSISLEEINKSIEKCAETGANIHDYSVYKAAGFWGNICKDLKVPNTLGNRLKIWKAADHLHKSTSGVKGSFKADEANNDEGTFGGSSSSLGVGVKRVKYKPCALAVEEVAKISDMTCEEEPKICILKTRELLSKAQLLMYDIEKLLDWCTSTGSNRRRCRMQECQASIEEDGETLVIEGFRFKSAASREDLRRLTSPAGRGAGRQGDA